MGVGYGLVGVELEEFRLDVHVQCKICEEYNVIGRRDL